MSGAVRSFVEDERAVERFVYEEARLLDERRFAEWLELFDEDGAYWVPAQPEQESPHDAPSLFFEHKSLLVVRVNRLQQPSMHAQAPPTRTHHQVGAVTAQQSRRGKIDIEVRSALIVCEWRNDEGRWFAGTVQHQLRRVPEGFRIVLKRVDLINCDAPHRALSVPF
jgi:3-phenylpropionate/cinnamic acid dioxygenase small subunit